MQGNDRGLLGTEQADVFDLSGLTAITGVPFVDARGGNDTLIGSGFADNLRGGAGDDTLDGRFGNDILDGGAGSNTYVYADGYGADRVVRYNAGLDEFDLTGVASVHSFSDLNMVQIDKTVLIDFGGGNTLTIDKTTIAILTANQSGFLFS
jgi:Ca2+-binding RTX toxin-like protein